MQQLHSLARADRLPLVEASRVLISGDRLRAAARNALAGFISALDRWREEAGRASHTDLAQIVLDKSGYTAMWQAERSPDAAGRLENLKELVVAMAEFENLGGFLEHVSLVMDNAADSGGNMVNLMTLHSAKGLEFDTVFLPGWEDGLFPNQRAMEENGLAALEEERRLAYVGLTRARHRGYVSFAANRRIHGQWQSAMRSRFVDELPSEHTEIVAEPRLQPGAARASAYADGWGQRRPAKHRRSQPVGRAPPSDADRKRVRFPAAAPRSAGSAGFRSATASSTRNSATAPSPPSRTTSSPSISSTPATKKSWTPTSNGSDASIVPSSPFFSPHPRRPVPMSTVEPDLRRAFTEMTTSQLAAQCPLRAVLSLPTIQTYLRDY